MYKLYNEFLADSPPTRDADSGDNEDVEDDEQEEEEEEDEMKKVIPRSR